MTYIISNVVPICCAMLLGLVIGTGFRIASTQEITSGIRWLWLLLVTAVAEFWLAAILAGALILAPVQANAWAVAIGTAVIIWIGFVVPVLAVSYPARGLKPSILLIDCTHWLIVMVGQAAVLKLIGLVRP